MYHKELLKGNTETLLLSLLANEVMYGYQIVKEIERGAAGTSSSKKERSTLPFHRLAESGLIEGRWGEADPGVPRRYYHITSKGEKVLEERQSEWRRFASAIDSVMLPQI